MRMTSRRARLPTDIIRHASDWDMQSHPESGAPEDQEELQTNWWHGGDVVCRRPLAFS
jgi:hypothetical protein